MTALSARRRLVLVDDGIIDPIAVELAAYGTRPVALTRTERQLAAAAILARGGTPYVIAMRLHVSGTTALKLAAHAMAPLRTPPGAAPHSWARCTCEPAPGAGSPLASAAAPPQERKQFQHQQDRPRIPGRR